MYWEWLLGKGLSLRKNFFMEGPLYIVLITFMKKMTSWLAKVIFSQEPWSIQLTWLLDFLPASACVPAQRGIGGMEVSSVLAICFNT
jgi:hypothetical protein